LRREPVLNILFATNVIVVSVTFTGLQNEFLLREKKEKQQEYLINEPHI
jgi:hypothetical protein